MSADALDDDFYLDKQVVDEAPPSAEIVVDDAIAENGEDTNAEDKEMPKEESKKRKKEQKQKKTKKQKTEEIETPVVERSKQDQLAYLHKIQEKTLPHLSSLELSEQRLPEERLLDTARFSSPHTLEHYASFIKFGVMSYKKKLFKKPTGDDAVGRPLVLVLAESAIRCTEIIRALDEFRKTARIAKLFAKHIKVEEQVTLLSKEHLNIAVGTPNRVLKLTEDAGALKLDRLELLVIDASHKDKKERTVFEVPEIVGDLYKFLPHFLNQSNISSRLALY
ncbi:uncharacterized protein VTP21DRAFT_1863 [Calcarisporiella thermophila]|uniref:uncharacterized protein n=1 Tax=Calcarisporiella thermophila TaxID=911321 RepID=UPI0037422523